MYDIYIYLYFQGSEINLSFQHGMRDFVLNGKPAIGGQQLVRYNC